MTSPRAFRIAHIDTGLTLRGGQRQMLLLAHGLRERGHEQVIVCLEGSGLEGRAQRDGFRVFSLPAHDPGHAFGILLWRQQLKTWTPHILHAHDGRGQTLAWLASSGLPVQRVLAAIAPWAPFSMGKPVAMILTREARKRLARPITAFCSCSSVGSFNSAAASNGGTVG